LRAGHFAAFADRVGHFAGFAQPNSHFAPLVTHDHERAEIEPPSTFHDFGGTVDEHHLFGQFLSLAAKSPFRRIATGTASASARAATATELVLLTAGTRWLLLLGTGGWLLLLTGGARRLLRFSATFYFIWFSHKIVLRSFRLC